jgi:hypothetical protein
LTQMQEEVELWKVRCRKLEAHIMPGKDQDGKAVDEVPPDKCRGGPKYSERANALSACQEGTQVSCKPVCCEVSHPAFMVQDNLIHNLVATSMVATLTL